MNRISLRAASLILGSLTAFAPVGCDEGDDDNGMVGGKAYPPAGRTVHVQFRRDYLGYATTGTSGGVQGTLSPLVGAMGEGAPQPVAASGVLKRVTDEFVIVQVVQVPNAPTRELWIPREAVLLLDVTRQEQK